MLNAPREIRGERSLHAAPQSIAWPAHSSNDRPTDRSRPGPRGAPPGFTHDHTHAHTYTPPAFHPTRGSPPRRLAPLLLPSPTSTAWRVARHVRFCAPRAGGFGTPGRHLPSSLSSTIISGAPCPAAAGLGGEKGAPTPGALRFVGATTDRPTDRSSLGQRSERGSNDPACPALNLDCTPARRTFRSEALRRYKSSLTYFLSSLRMARNYELQFREGGGREERKGVGGEERIREPFLEFLTF